MSDNEDKQLWTSFRGAARRAGVEACPDLAVRAGYLDGRISPEEIEAFERHLAACDACLEELLDVRGSVEPRLDLPASLLERAQALVAPRQRGSQQLRRRVHLWQEGRPVGAPSPLSWAALAAMLFLACVGGFVVGRRTLTNLAEAGELRARALLGEGAAAVAVGGER